MDIVQPHNLNMPPPGGSARYLQMLSAAYILELLEAVLAVFISIPTWLGVLVVGLYTARWLFVPMLKISASFVVFHFSLKPFRVKNTTYVVSMLGLLLVWVLYGAVRTLMVVL
eukprot:8552843-Pyramimonas_sp.AAC.1